MHKYFKASPWLLAFLASLWGGPYYLSLQDSSFIDTWYFIPGVVSWLVGLLLTLAPAVEILDKGESK